MENVNKTVETMEKLQELAQIISALVQIVRCPICIDHIDNAVELECGHAFCKACLHTPEIQQCPVCRRKICRRSFLYKDQFMDDLSKFVSSTCRLIKEYYSYDVEGLIIAINILQTVRNPALQNSSVIHEGIDKSSKAANGPHTKHVNQNEVLVHWKKGILNFDNNDTRLKVISWLNDNERTSSFLTNLNSEDLDLPSISQVASKRKRHIRVRSQSFTIDDNVSRPRLMKSHSIEGLLDHDNYSIEEVQSEDILKEVKRKVLQDILEDECLSNLEEVAKQTAKNIRLKDDSPKQKVHNTSNSDRSSGWDRINKEISKDGKKSSKTSLEKQPPIKRNVKGKRSIKKSHVLENKENSKQLSNQIMDNLEKHRIKTSSSSDINIIELTVNEAKEPHLKNSTKKAANVSENINEDIYLMPTQKTSETGHESSAIFPVNPVPKESSDINNVTNCLLDVLHSCITSAGKLEGDINQCLVNCFTNIKAYVDRIQTLLGETDMGNDLIKQVIKTNVGTQTKITQFLNQLIQTEQSEVKMLSVSWQTSQKVLENDVHVENKSFVNQKVQTTEHNPVITISDNNKSFTNRIQAIGYNSTMPVDEENNTTHGSCSLSSLKDSKKTSSKNVTTRISEEAKSRAQPKIEEIENVSASPKDSFNLAEQKKQNGNFSGTTKDSVLMCSLMTTTNRSNQKLNRKLIYEEPSTRKFKRIRKPTSGSSSDEEKPLSKKKFIRDDLTIEFIESEITKSENNSEKTNSITESDKVDYDKYLLNIMAKYGTPPPDNNPSSSFNYETKSQKLSTDHNNDSEENAKEIKSQKTSCNNDHIFTGDTVFEENISKFEKDILEHEQQSKTYNTEFDLIEDTPLVISKPNRATKLQTSDKRKSQKETITKPLQIISKGAAACSVYKTKTLTKLDPHTQTENCSVNVDDLLEDLKNDDDFFNENMETDEKISKEDHLEVHKEKLSQDNLEIALTANQNNENQVLKQKNIEEDLQNFNEYYEDDPDIEAELQKISLTTQMQNPDNKINLISNLKLKSQDKFKIKTLCNEIIDSSDEEFIDTTPQKKKNSSREESLLPKLEELGNSIVDNQDLCICLPPPPGFGDEADLMIEERSPVNQTKEFPIDKSSLTPDRLTDFIVTPDLQSHGDHARNQVEAEDLNNSLTFKSTDFLPGNLTRITNSPHRYQNIHSQIGRVFSPKAKSTMNLSQLRHTPLVPSLRSSAKKSNLMTSTPNQKSILNYVRSSQKSASATSQKPRPCIMWTRILNKGLTVFTQLEGKKLITTSQSFNSQVTHLVVLVDERGCIKSHTAKFLLAVAAGIWVVRYEWVEDCLKMNQIVPEEPYEALDTTGVPGPRISRLTRTTNPLFKGYKFFCAPPFTIITRQDIENVLQFLEGEVVKDLGSMLEEDDKIKIILTDTSATEDIEQFETWLDIYKAATVDVEWLTKCIGQYKVVSFRSFLLCSQSLICDLDYPSTLLEFVPLTLTETL